ncbi:MAG: hypothetical protein RH942_03895 [Kiloniellaceae bacterium]
MLKTFINLPLIIAVVTSLALSACQETIPKEALQLSPKSLEQRQAQTRRFQTAAEASLLSASAAVLQDLGFNIDEGESALGVIVGSKDRDATEAGQVAGAVVMAILFGVATPVDDKQKIRASIVTRPQEDENGWTAVRITFQRVVWNTNGQVSRSEALTEPELYQEFFSKLSKSVFLEAHEI